MAVGGLDHAIYRVDFQGIHTEAILDSTFDNVQFYLPIHVRNYRDDLIVLVQHEIDHDSHSSIHVEALIWTENGFVTSAHEICDDHGQIRYIICICFTHKFCFIHYNSKDQHFISRVYKLSVSSNFTSSVIAYIFIDLLHML